MRPSVSLSIVLAVATLAGACAAPAQPSPPASDAPGGPSPTPARSSPPPRPTPEVRPAIAAGEAWLVLQAYDDAGRTTIQLVRPDGTDAHPLLDGPGPGAEQAHPAWSPDGEWIAFDAWHPQPTGADRIEMWVARVNGTDARVVASCETPCLQLAYPAWSPDGASIVHTRYDVRPDGTWGPAAIEVLDVASGDRRVLAETADGRTAYYEPRWSPDGRSIVITVETYPDEAQESVDASFIAVIAADGEGPVAPVRITPDGMFAREPDWAPADRIVFALGNSHDTWVSTASIATIGPDGSDLRRVTDPTARDAVAWEPVWAGDGRTIIASTLAGGAQRIATIDAAGEPKAFSWRAPTPANDPRRVHVHPRPETPPAGDAEPVP